MEGKILSAKEQFEQFSIDNWYNWIDDILIHNFAYPPAPKLSNEQEPLIDILDFLKRSNVSTQKYEESIINITGFYCSDKFIPKLERLINVMIYAKSLRFKNKLLSLYSDSYMDKYFGNKDYLKSKILLGLSRLELTDPEKKKVYEYVQLTGLSKFDFNPSFIGSYFRFIGTHYPNLFFKNLTVLCKTLPFESKDENYKTSIRTLLFDKLHEYHYNNKTIFYSSALNWLLDTYAFMHTSGLYIELINALEKLFSFSKIIKLEITNENSEQANYGQHLNMLLNFLTVNKEAINHTLLQLYSFLKFIAKKQKIGVLKLAFSKPALNKLLKANYTLYKDYFSYHQSHPYYQQEAQSIIIDQINQMDILNLLDRSLLSPLYSDDEIVAEEKKELISMFDFE